MKPGGLSRKIREISTNLWDRLLNLWLNFAWIEKVLIILL